jgi:large repetitive protein
MGTRRDNPGSAVLNGDIYVFGGRTRNADGSGVENLGTVEVFDPGTGTWSSAASMPTARRTMVVVVANGRAFVIGGERKVDGTAFDVNEEYDPLTNTWRTLKPMPTARHGAVAGVVNGVVYVIGGATSSAATSVTSVNEAFPI